MEMIMLLVLKTHGSAIARIWQSCLSLRSGGDGSEENGLNANGGSHNQRTNSNIEHAEMGTLEPNKAQFWQDKMAPTLAASSISQGFNQSIANESSNHQACQTDLIQKEWLRTVMIGNNPHHGQLGVVQRPKKTSKLNGTQWVWTLAANGTTEHSFEVLWESTNEFFLLLFVTRRHTLFTTHLASFPNNEIKTFSSPVHCKQWWPPSSEFWKRNTWHQHQMWQCCPCCMILTFSLLSGNVKTFRTTMKVISMLASRNVVVWQRAANKGHRVWESIISFVVVCCKNGCRSCFFTSCKLVFTTNGIPRSCSVWEITWV